MIGSLNGTTKGSLARVRQAHSRHRRSGSRAQHLRLAHRSRGERCRDRGPHGRHRPRGQELDLDPLAVKLSPYYTAPVHLAKCLEVAGADGLVLFNRFYQPDIDPEELEISRSLRLSSSTTCCCGCVGWRSSRAGSSGLRGHRRHPHPHRRHQGHHGGCRRDPDDLRLAEERPGIPVHVREAWPPG